MLTSPIRQTFEILGRNYAMFSISFFRAGRNFIVCSCSSRTWPRRHLHSRSFYSILLLIYIFKVVTVSCIKDFGACNCQALHSTLHIFVVEIFGKVFIPVGYEIRLRNEKGSGIFRALSNWREMFMLIIYRLLLPSLTPHWN